LEAVRFFLKWESVASWLEKPSGSLGWSFFERSGRLSSLRHLSLPR
jgi:hypothetical protein